MAVILVLKHKAYCTVHFVVDSNTTPAPSMETAHAGKSVPDLIGRGEGGEAAGGRHGGGGGRGQGQARPSCYQIRIRRPLVILIFLEWENLFSFLLLLLRT